MVAKFNPIRLGKRKVSRELSQVPSPTCNVSDEYVLLPGAVSPLFDDIVAAISSTWRRRRRISS